MTKLVQFTAVLATLLAIVFANPAFAQDEYDCADFSSQAEAQAVFEQDRSDPYGLDADDDSIACEELPPGEATTESNTSKDTPEQTQKMDEQATNASSQYEQYPSEIQYGQDNTVLPDTGGPSLLLVLAVVALGLSGFIVAYAFIRG